jgi:hypothetical protein
LSGRLLLLADFRALSGVKKGVEKKTGKTSIPVFLIRRVASMLSSPPEKIDIAFMHSTIPARKAF